MTSAAVAQTRIGQWKQFVLFPCYGEFMTKTSVDICPLVHQDITWRFVTSQKSGLIRTYDIFYIQCIFFKFFVLGFSSNRCCCNPVVMKTSLPILLCQVSWDIVIPKQRHESASLLQYLNIWAKVECRDCAASIAAGIDPASVHSLWDLIVLLE